MYITLAIQIINIQLWSQNNSGNMNKTITHRLAKITLILYISFTRMRLHNSCISDPYIFISYTLRTGCDCNCSVKNTTYYT